MAELGVLINNVVILPQYKFVMFCIPKAANSSIKAAILHTLGYGENLGQMINHRHKALNISSPKKVFNNYMQHFKAVIVRNPFDRLVSCFESKIKVPAYCSTRGFARHGFHTDMNFKQYIEKVKEVPFGNYHYEPQYPSLVHDGCFLPDYVGKFENLRYAWNNIRYLCGIDFKSLPHIHKSPRRRPYREYYNKYTRVSVERMFADDLEKFGYEF